MVSDFRAIPGPDVVVTAREPPIRGPEGGADAGDLVLGCSVRTPNSLWRLSSCRMSLAGVIG